MQSQHEARLLAIDIRSQQFGYAVFIAPDRLLDYGGGQLRPGGRQGALLAAKRMKYLFRVFAPSAIAVKRPRRSVTRKYPGICAIVRAIQKEAAAHLVPHRFIHREEIREAFGKFAARNKHQIAVTLCEMFPELKRMLPAERELGDPEHPRMVVFDAVSVGFTYWHQSGAAMPSPE